MRPFLRGGDFWSGLALAALGAWIVAEARGWVYMNEEGPGPGFFPMAYGVLMVILSLALVAGAVRGRRGGPDAPSRGDVARALACWGAFVGAIALMGILGFAVSFALLTWFIVAVMARRPQAQALALGIGGGILFHVLFTLLLDVSLPRGLLF